MDECGYDRRRDEVRDDRLEGELHGLSRLYAGIVQDVLLVGNVSRKLDLGSEGSQC